MRSRPFLSRLLLATAGMTMLGLGVYVGLGYAVREKKPVWLISALGAQRCYDLEGAYTRALGSAFPADGDGDYFPDSVEAYVRSDPADPRSHPQVSFSHEGEGIFAIEATDPNSLNRPHFVLQPGEPRRIRARLEFRGRPLAFCRGMQLRLACPNLSARGGQFPPLVSVSADGVVEFDVLSPKDAVGWNFDTIIEAYHPVKTLYYGMIAIDTMWRQPELPYTAEKTIPEDDASAQMFRSVGTVVGMRLRWAPVKGADVLYIEAACENPAGDASPGEWFVVGAFPSGSSSCMIGYDPDLVRSGKTKGLKFRVVPASRTPGT